MTRYKTDLKLPLMKIKKYWGSSEIYLDTNNRNGNNYRILRLIKGPITQRGKHFYYLNTGSYKSHAIEIDGVDLID